MKSLLLAIFLLITIGASAAQATWPNPPFWNTVLYGSQEVQIQPGDAIVLLNNPQSDRPDGRAQVVYLPPNPSVGQVITIKDAGGTAGTNAMIIYPYGRSGSIDGSPSYSLNTNYGSVTFVFSANGAWTIISTAGATVAVFTDTAAGLVPASGGGTTKFLRADATFAVPSASAVSSVSNSDGTLTISPTTGAVVASIVALPSARIFVGNAGSVATGVAMSGDTTISNAGAVTIANSAVTNAKMANMANNTIKGNISGGSAAPSDLSTAQITTTVNVATDLLTGAIPALTDAKIVVGKTASNVQAVTMSGDTTITNTGAVTIANNAVTNAKAAQMAAHTIKGNNTGSTANAIDLTDAQATAELGVATDGLQGVIPALTDGKIIVGKTASNVQAVSPSGDVATISNAGAFALSTTGVSAASYTQVNATVDAKGRITAMSSGFTTTIVSASGAQAGVAGNAYFVTATSGTVTFTLPTAVGVSGGEIIVFLTGTGATLTFNTTSAQTISGQASGAISTTVQYNGYRFISDGTNWQLE